VGDVARERRILRTTVPPFPRVPPHPSGARSNRMSLPLVSMPLGAQHRSRTSTPELLRNLFLDPVSAHSSRHTPRNLSHPALLFRPSFYSDDTFIVFPCLKIPPLCWARGWFPVPAHRDAIPPFFLSSLLGLTYDSTGYEIDMFLSSSPLDARGSPLRSDISLFFAFSCLRLTLLRSSPPPRIKFRNPTSSYPGRRGTFFPHLSNPLFQHSCS